MNPKEKVETGHGKSQNQESKNAPKEKDIWDKIDICMKPLGALFTAVVITLIGFLTTTALERNKNKELNSRLYSELMSKQEESDTKLRSEMFHQIFQTFIKTPEQDINDTTHWEIIDNQLLSLELLTRNFHETIDIKPLFQKLLMDIVRSKPPNREIEKKSSKKVNIDSLQHIDSSLQCKVQKRKNKLLTIARRMTRKQLEILKQSGSFMEMNIHFNSVDTCWKPNCPKPDSCTCNKNNFKEIRKDTTLTILTKSDTLSRHFRISLIRTYPKWKQIRIRVEISPDSTQLKKSDKLHINKVFNDTIEFWVSYFDFPIVDNTFLSEGERYSVALSEGSDDTNGGEDSTQLTLVYFPAAFAGLKEKAYYHQKALNRLEQSDFFDEEK